MKDCISRLKASLASLAEESGDSYKKRPSYKTSTYFHIKQSKNQRLASSLFIFIECFLLFDLRHIDLSLYDKMAVNLFDI